jgi:hypothetical protein
MTTRKPTPATFPLQNVDRPKCPNLGIDLAQFKAVCTIRPKPACKGACTSPTIFLRWGWDPKRAGGAGLIRFGLNELLRFVIGGRCMHLPYHFFALGMGFETSW